MASRYESSPNPIIEPATAAAIMDLWRYSSRAWILEMCTSTTGAGTARMASLKALNLVDEFALDIGLEVADAVVGIALLQLAEKVVETFLPVNALFPFAQQVEVGPVDNEYIHNNNLFCTESLSADCPSGLFCLFRFEAIG